MIRYWSSSKLADKIRGTKKPQIGSLDDWDNWEDNAQKNPVRYWLAEEGLDHLQSIIRSPIKLKDMIRIYIKNRWKDKTHALTSSLKRGQYHELDERMLYALFDEFVLMIEDEMYFNNTDYWDKKRRRFIKKNKQARLEAGLAYLDWASRLTYGDDEGIEKEDPKYGTLTSHAVSSKEMLALYFWWKFERPNRPDPMAVTGLSELYDRYPGSLLPKIPDEEKEFHDTVSQNTFALEAHYDQEDEDMLIRLIKIRRHLWV